MKIWNIVMQVAFGATLVACLAFATSNLSADIVDNYESHAVGTSLSSLGYTFNGYSDLLIDNVGVGGSRGFEAAPGTAASAFPNAQLSETGGQTIRLAMDVRMRNGGASQNVGVNQAAFFLSLSNASFSDSVFGIFQRSNGVASQIWGLTASDSSGSQSTIPGGSRQVSELGLTNNAVGDWTDWFRFELEVVQLSANLGNATMEMRNSNGNLIESISYQSDFSYLANGPIVLGIGSSNQDLIVDLVAHDNLEYFSTVPEPGSGLAFGFATVILAFRRRRN